MKALPELYGPNFDSDVQKPHFQNVRTAARMARTHHCSGTAEGEHAMIRSCFTRGHQGTFFESVYLCACLTISTIGYCPAFVDVNSFRTRCGHHLKLWSEGCGNPLHATNLPNSMAKAIQELFDGKREVILWEELNDPRLMEQWHAEQANLLPAVQEVQEQHEDALEEYLAEGDMDGEIDSSRLATYKIYEDRKVEEKLRAKTDAALNKQLDEMTLAALDPKIKKLEKTESDIFKKAWHDTRERMRTILQSTTPAEVDAPKNPQIEELNAKRANGGKSVKAGGTKVNAGHRKWAGTGSRKRGGRGIENQPPA